MCCETDTGDRTRETGHRIQDTGHRTQDTGHRTQDAGREIDDKEAEVVRESISLLYEYEMLEPDNEYGWDSWTARAERLMIHQRLYEFLKDKGVDFKI